MQNTVGTGKVSKKKAKVWQTWENQVISQDHPLPWVVIACPFCHFEFGFCVFDSNCWRFFCYILGVLIVA